MSEDTTTLDAQAPELDRAADNANLKSVGKIHFVAALAALTLWGAADAWAASSGWALAWAVAVANAIVAGMALTGIGHEWGHYLGARLAGSYAPARPEPVSYFFMFDFSFDHNDKRQFVWMSLGGILAPWALVLLTLALVPIDNVSRAALLATFVARAIGVTWFEGPVTLRSQQGGDPRQELGNALPTLATGRYAGTAAGVLLWLLLV